MSLKFETEDGIAHEALLVHAPGQPGSLILDRLSGVILTPLMERPDWADGLAVALLHEHRQFYQTRTGSYAEPQIFALPDLGWVGANEEGNEIEVEADIEYRMNVLAERMGMDREEGDLGRAMAEVEFSLDHHRTDGEVSALVEAGADIEQKQKASA